MVRCVIGPSWPCRVSRLIRAFGCTAYLGFFAFCLFLLGRGGIFLGSCPPCLHMHPLVTTLSTRMGLPGIFFLCLSSGFFSRSAALQQVGLAICSLCAGPLLQGRLVICTAVISIICGSDAGQRVPASALGSELHPALLVRHMRHAAGLDKLRSAQLGQHASSTCPPRPPGLRARCSCTERSLF